MSELTHDPFDTRDRTPSTDAQAMTREQVEEIIEGGDAETFLRHDAAQRETIRRLEEKVSDLRQEFDRALYDYCVMKEKKDDLLARLTASEARIRACTQTIIAEIGSNGPENLEESIKRLITKLDTLPSSRRWTTARPTVAGWYFHRDVESQPVVYTVVNTKTGLVVLFHAGVDPVTRIARTTAFPVETIPGEWQGPLTPGEE